MNVNSVDRQSLNAQGSVLAPLLYIIYKSEFGPLLAACALLGQLHNDDIQAYLHCLSSDAMAAVRAMTLATGALDVIKSTAAQSI